MPHLKRKLELKKKKPTTLQVVQHLISVSALKGPAQSAPIDTVGTAQLADGTMNVVDIPTKTVRGVVSVTSDPAKIDWTEHWVATDTAYFTGGGGASQPADMEIQKVSNVVQTWTDARNQLLALPNSSTFLHAELNFQYNPPPNLTAINNITNLPNNWGRQEFRVRTVSPGGDNVTGGLFRVIQPNNTTTMTEHWRLLPNYVRPHDGNVTPQGGTVAVVEKIAGGKSELKDFLLQFHGLGGEYVQVTYTWGPL